MSPRDEEARRGETSRRMKEGGAGLGIENFTSRKGVADL